VTRGVDFEGVQIRRPQRLYIPEYVLYNFQNRLAGGDDRFLIPLVCIIHQIIVKQEVTDGCAMTAARPDTWAST